jgi:hypothetical protein
MKGHTPKKLASFSAALGLTLALCLGAPSITQARPVSGATAPQAGSTETSAALESVDSISILTRPWSWRAIDDRTVIIWATPFRPYLVELAFPSYDLKFAQVIGVTSFGDRIYAKFDSVKVRGFRYPISGIYKMTREQAKNWGRAS